MNLGMMRRRPVEKIENYLMTTETNPQVLSVCYAQGWCASPDYMTYEEAANVTDIGTVFRDNTQITHFEELNFFGVSYMEDYAFSGCNNLLRIVLPAKLKDISYSCFRDTKSSFEISIPEGVTNILGASFMQTGIVSITIPSSVKMIKERVFFGCSKCKSVTLLPTVPPTLGNNSFVYNNCIIYVPAESVDVYKSASVWSVYANRIQAIPT